VIPRILFLQLPQGFTALLSGNTLKARSVKSGSWTISGFGLQYSLRLVSTLFLTRLLTPEAFGLMSLATVILAGLALISDIGTTPSIIRSKRGDDPDFLQTAWTLQVIRGVAITLCACLLAWPLAHFYDEPLLFPMVTALSLTALLQGLSSVGIPIAKRQMALRRLTLLEVSAHAATVFVTVVVAWQYKSVWALVAGALFGSVLHLVLSHLLLPKFRHVLRWDKKAVSEIIVFGRWILLATLLTFLGGKGLAAIQGALVPNDILGMLTIAGTLAWALGDLTGKLLSNIAFPALSELIRERPQDVARNLRKIQLVLIGAGLPCFLFLSFIARELIDLMYDDRYTMAGVFLSIMALNGAAGVLSMPYQNALLAAGQSRAHAIIMGLAAVLKITGAFVGFNFGGVVGMLAVIGFANALVLVVAALLAHWRGMANLLFDAVALAVLAVAYATTLLQVTSS